MFIHCLGFIGCWGCMGHRGRGKGCYGCMLVVGCLNMCCIPCDAFCFAVRIWISDHAGHQFLQFIVWLLPAVGLCFLATLVVQKISTSCIGSGIPEMKSVLSGIILENFLTFRTLLAKVLGLTLAIGGGLIVGKEGPAVHISAAIANNLMRFRCFRKVRKASSRRRVSDRTVWVAFFYVCVFLGGREGSGGRFRTSSNLFAPLFDRINSSTCKCLLLRVRWECPPTLEPPSVVSFSVWR